MQLVYSTAPADWANVNCKNHCLIKHNILGTSFNDVILMKYVLISKQFAEITYLFLVYKIAFIKRVAFELKKFGTEI